MQSFNGGEYISKEFQYYLPEMELNHRRCVPKHQNRMKFLGANTDMLEVTRAFLIKMNVPK